MLALAARLLFSIRIVVGRKAIYIYIYIYIEAVTCVRTSWAARDVLTELNGYMGKWVIILQYPTYTHTYMSNPYPPQILWVWIWIRAMVNQWHLEAYPDCERKSVGCTVNSIT